MSSTGSAPAFNCVARSFARPSVNDPEITPEPAQMAPLTVGEEMIVRSTAIAISF